MLFYHTGIGALNVYLMNSLGPQQTVFNVSGNKGDVWLKGQATLSYNQAFYILFEGVRGNNFNGDIALDDISVVAGSCGSQPTGSTPSPTSFTTAGK